MQAARNKYQEQGLLATYPDIADLKAAFQLHLSSLVNTLLRRDRTPGLPVGVPEPATLPLPDVRVKIAGFAAVGDGGAGEANFLRVEVQNHSPRDFHLANVWFELKSGARFCIGTEDRKRAGHSGWPKRIEPGDSAWFDFPAQDIVRASHGERVVAAVAVDKIDRQFRSPPRTLESELNWIRPDKATEADDL